VIRLDKTAADRSRQNDRWEEIDGDSVGLEYELSQNGLEAAAGQPEYRPEEAALWPTFASGESFTAILSPAGGSGSGNRLDRVLRILMRGMRSA